MKDKHQHLPILLEYSFKLLQKKNVLNEVIVLIENQPKTFRLKKNCIHIFFFLFSANFDGYK